MYVCFYMYKYIEDIFPKNGTAAAKIIVTCNEGEPK